MHCKIGFARTDDARLLVLTDVRECLVNARNGISTTQFDDENVFLMAVVLADFPNDVITDLVASALQALSRQAHGTVWTKVECHEHQLRSFGLDFGTSEPIVLPALSSSPPNDEDLANVFMQSPTSVTMMCGPSHEFTFINPAYVRILGRKSASSVLGKSVREALPELHGQPFFGLLDRVYRTGEPFVGKEVRAYLKNEETGELGEFYFDFIYHPVRNDDGEIRGILCQANDVTDRVLARQVSEARETRLYEQWAELEAIYRKSSVGMALVDIKEFRIKRINDMNARLLSASALELEGKRIFDLFPDLESLKSIYHRVAGGEEVRNVRIELVSATDEPDQHLLANFSPVRDIFGAVEAIASVTIDLTNAHSPEESVVVDMATCTHSVASSHTA